MRIRFEGFWDVPDSGTPDESGNIDIWLLEHIKNTIIAGPETDDVYSNLGLQWWVAR